MPRGCGWTAASWTRSSTAPRKSWALASPHGLRLPDAADDARAHSTAALRFDPRRDDRRPDDRGYDERRRPKKKDGWLGELFDFEPRGPGQSSRRAMNSRACLMEMSEWRVRASAAASVSPLLARVRILP